MDDKWKKRALALSVAAAVSVASPLYEDKNYIAKAGTDEDASEKFEKDDAYHGTGATPFVFPSKETQITHGGSYVHFSTSNWKAWNDSSGSHSYNSAKMSSSSS